MRRLLLPLALAILVATAATANGASLLVNQRYVDGKGRVVLLVRSGGKGFLTGRTACGRLVEQPLSLRGGKVRSRKGARIRVSGTVTSSRSVQLRVTRKRCSASLTLRRNTKPE